jgi:hypothetical protein
MDVSSIPGWFEFADLYDHAIETAPAGSTLVEVGVFCGKSLAYLAGKAREANKGLRVFGVDNFRGSPEHRDGTSANLGSLPPFALAAMCMENLDRAGVLDSCTLIRSNSVAAARLFPVGSVYMAFIDADHSYQSVKADVTAWLPTIRPGGLLAGDDYRTFEGVRRAVDLLLPNREVKGCWWANRLPEFLGPDPEEAKYSLVGMV